MGFEAQLAPRIGLLVARTPIVALAGVTAVFVATVVYSYQQGAMAVATQGDVNRFVWVGVLYLFVMTLGIAAVALDLRRVLSRRVAEVRLRGFAPTSPGWLLPYVLSLGKYRRFFVASAIIYGLIYAVITSMIVYQPTVDFAKAYGAAVPSAILTPRGSPLYAPDLIAYLPGHIGIQLIPLTVILLITISTLVGANIAVSAFAFDSRARGDGKGLTGALGALVGLFTGCPTCAGIFFANTLGGSGAASFATLLGYYQPAFILLSIPVLLATPYLTSRSLAKVYLDGCVHFKTESGQRS